MSGKWRVFPFTALVGQEKIKRALLANAVLPSIGGVLLRGEKGTAKSTAVRGLASLLPQSQAVAGCPWHCDPLAPEEWLCPSCAGKKRKGALPSVAFAPQLADVPLSASEDRVAGSLDMEAAFREGVRVLQPGLLAAAHRGILYIDEVNLLPDHVADVILEACSEGVNRIRREGISAEHPSRFVLVGTMNPEEGELRPQLLGSLRGWRFRYPRPATWKNGWRSCGYASGLTQIRKDFFFSTRNGRPRLPSASGRRSGSSRKSVSPGFC